MREILFRGKDTERNVWHEGQYIHLHKTTYCFDGSKECNADNEIHQIVFEQMTDWNLPNCHMRVDVLPETVGEFTGLTDKNGKKIFEGDIVELFDMRGKIVQECGAFGIATTQQIDYDLLDSKIPFQNNAYFCFNDNFISIWELWWNYHQDDEPLEVAEVIGNIYDTPELLKGDCCK